MPAYLSDEWFDEARRLLDAVVVDPPVDPPLTISQTVLDGPDGTSAYRLRLDGAAVTIERDGREAPPADVRCTQTYEVAAEIARGERSAQRAFMDGLVQVGGDIGRLIEYSTVLDSLGDPLAGLRATTTY